jgi:hypothetical protein
MTGFDARLFEFQEVDNPDLLSERIWGKLTLRHVMYIFAAIVVGWGGLSSKSSVAMAVSLFISLVAVVGALYPQKSVTFEAILFGAVMYVINGSKVPDPEEVARRKEQRLRERKLKKSFSALKKRKPVHKRIRKVKKVKEGWAVFGADFLTANLDFKFDRKKLEEIPRSVASEFNRDSGESSGFCREFV